MQLRQPMRATVSCCAFVLAVSVCATGCATAVVNSIAGDRSPRLQAAAILTLTAVNAVVAVYAAQMAQRGESVCTPNPDAGEDFYTSKNSCTTPAEYAAGAAMFGLAGSIDVGAAIYQLATNKRVFNLREGRAPAPAAVKAPLEAAVVQHAAPIRYATPPAFDRETCIRVRADRQRRALLVDDLAERGRLLRLLPECKPPRALGTFD